MPAIQQFYLPDEVQSPLLRLRPECGHTNSRQTSRHSLESLWMGVCFTVLCSSFHPALLLFLLLLPTCRSGARPPGLAWSYRWPPPHSTPTVREEWNGGEQDG